MKKPTLYVDTSIISAYWYEGNDMPMLVRRLRTREWWRLECKHFVVWASDFGETELEAGAFRKQRECLKMIRRLRYLSVTALVRSLVNEIVRRGLVPANKAGDAQHLAVSAAHGMDFLLTWNYAHMANPIVQANFEGLCVHLGLVAPLMVSPESIPQVRFGQSIRRSS